MSKYTLLTGASGLLGRYLLRDLLRAGRRVAVVVRPSRKQRGRERVEAILRHWETQDGCVLPRPVCFEGDVSQTGLGLNDSSRTWVAEHCASFVHSAAVLTFEQDSSGEPWRTNVGGTRNVLELCEETGIRQLHYVSTAYVCGLREGLVREPELDCGQDFRNDYEKSKLVAETLVHDAPFLDHRTIYRPAVIAGDSVTGYTNTYHGLYLYLKLMSILVWNTEPGPDGVRNTPVRLGMTGDEPRNIVPVDWVSTVICHLFNTPQAHGHTFHLTPACPITPREVIEAGYKYFNSRGVEFAGAVDEPSPISAMDRDAHENMVVYKSYEASDPCFDRSNLQRFAADLPCPELDVPMLHRYWKYGEEDRWGKRRETTHEVGPDAGSLLRQLVENRSESELAGLRSLGVDVVGPGGGQWSLVPNGDQRPALKVGIASDCRLLARLSHAELKNRLEEDGRSDLLDWLRGLAQSSTRTGRSYSAV